MYRLNAGKLVVFMCVHIIPCYSSMNNVITLYSSFLSLLSSHTVFMLPNLNSTFVLVSKFIILGQHQS